jgi:hypothetical protein
VPHPVPTTTPRASRVPMPAVPISAAHEVRAAINPAPVGRLHAATTALAAADVQRCSMLLNARRFMHPVLNNHSKTRTRLARARRNAVEAPTPT